MADAQRKRDLIAQLDRARSRATAHQRELGNDLQVGDKLKENVDRHRGVWLGSAALLGLAISKLPPRTKKIVIQPGGRARAEREVKEVGKWGLVIAAAKWLFDLIRPMLVTWGTRRLTQAIGGPRSMGGSASYRRV